jgi:iron-sulfur cluster repair protein YtfE (RIC family)
MRNEATTKELIVEWRILADLLEVHAKAEETILYPVLLKRGGDQAPDETLDAIGDHNQIRDAIQLASHANMASDSWWAAVDSCRKANDEHLMEEERDVIPDFRLHTDVTLRRVLGAQWQAFHDAHRAARGISKGDVEPTEFVEANS